jgi:hypothetical protein
MKDQQFKTSDAAFEYAAKQLGFEPENLIPDVSKMPEWLQKSTLANIKLDIIAECLRGGKPLEKGKWHWFPVFTKQTDNKSGSGFSYADAYLWFTDTSTGARREFHTREDAEYFGKQFLDLHIDSKCIIISEEVNSEEN